MKGTVVLWGGELLSIPAIPNPVLFRKARGFFPEFFLAQTELERALFLPWALVRDGRMARIFVAVCLDSCCSRLLSTPHRDSHPGAGHSPDLVKLILPPPLFSPQNLPAPAQKVQMELCRRAICRDGRCFCSMDLAESIVGSLLPVWKALCCKNYPSSAPH